jgi:hypothetical protein
MRSLGLALVALVALLIAPAAFAQIDPGDGIDNVAGLGDGCAGTMNPDQCMFGDSDATNGWSSTICRQSYCPSCFMNQTQTASLCGTLLGNMGSCKCTPSGTVTTDKYGNKWPACQTSGSCGPLR